MLMLIFLKQNGDAYGKYWSFRYHHQPQKKTYSKLFKSNIISNIFLVLLLNPLYANEQVSAISV